MSLLKWSDKYSVKVKEMDDQHIQLLDLINKIHDAMKARTTSDEMGRIFTELLKYTEKHFSLEESYMAKARYNRLEEQKNMHKEFIGKIKEYKEQFEGGRTTTSIQTIQFLKDWLINHIMKEDIKYADDFHKIGIN